MTAADQVPRRAVDPPSSALEKSLVDIWTEVLEVPQVGVHDNFFDLGGTSRAAAEMLSVLEEQFACTLPMDLVGEASTVAELADRLRVDGRVRGGALGLVRLSPGGAGTNFFCVHGMGGHVLVFAELARRLAGEVSFYAFESANRYVDDDEPASIAGMAERYLREVRRIQPRGPHHLGGYSMGGLVALEMAHRLATDGEPAGMVALLDTDLVQIRTPVEPRAIDFVSRALGVTPPVSMPMEQLGAAAELIRARLVEQTGRPCRLSVAAISRFAHAYVRNQSAVEGYQIPDHDGDVRLFYSTRGPHEAARERADVLRLTGWAGTALADRMTVVPIESDHWTLLSASVEALSEQLRRALVPGR
ncbi:MAG: alpha/beta fold hydrolase [Mycobacteriales bacterium]